MSSALIVVGSIFAFSVEILAVEFSSVSIFDAFVVVVLDSLEVLFKLASSVVSIVVDDDSFCVCFAEIEEPSLCMFKSSSFS